MKGLKEFKARIESDKAFCAKFAGKSDEKQLLALAKAEGYDLEQLTDEELDMVAGGVVFGSSIGDWIGFAVKTAMFTFDQPVSTVSNFVKAIADNDKGRLARLAAVIDSQDIYELGDKTVNKVIDKGIDKL
ncbi:MAG: Nif11-like leader peptide family natural product precursor [Selenomonadaceae bacterium]|nr:Nif11-like leader peptide family natural product precursor [Selenomonadaceae bacterium]